MARVDYLGSPGRHARRGPYVSELTRAYIERIHDIDWSGPQLNAVIEINPDAVAIARQLDSERRQGQVRGPLHGIPILFKDNIATADGMEMTSLGSTDFVSVDKRDVLPAAATGSSQELGPATSGADRRARPWALG